MGVERKQRPSKRGLGPARRLAVGLLAIIALLAVGLPLDFIPRGNWSRGSRESGWPLAALDLRPEVPTGHYTAQQEKALMQERWERGDIGPTGAALGFRWGWRWAWLPGGTIVAFCPYGMLVNGLTVAALLAACWWGADAWNRRHNPRYLPGHCRRCGYDLAGNVSGVCPECGQPVCGFPRRGLPENRCPEGRGILPGEDEYA